MIMENYFSTLSKWIVNLGVVPWLLFLAFLLLPIFTFLFSLLFLVTLVLETISQLLCAQMYCRYNYSRLAWHKLKSNNRKKLHTFKFLVKAPLYLSLAIDSPLSAEMLGNQSFQRLIDRETSTLTLSKGEMVQLSLKNIKRFSIGNKEILSIKKLPSGKMLLLKAKSLGQTYFYFWENKGEAKRIEVFVHSKRHLLSQKKIANELEKLGFSTQIFEKKIQVRGKIETQHQYNSFLHLHKVYKDKLILGKLFVNKKIQLEKFSELIGELSEKGLLDLDCSPKDLFIFCKASEGVQKSLLYLENRFLMKFPSKGSLSLSKQYQVSLTLHQFENSQGDAFEFGLQNIEGKLNSLLVSDPLALIRDNQISLKENQFKSQTLASPILKGRLQVPMTVRIGQEINFLQSVTNGIATQSWRFAGLGIDITLVPHTDRLLLRYKTNLSQPGEQGIAINSQKSELLVELDKEQVLFDIGFKVNQQRNRKIPYLGSIPIFGSLFQANGSENSFKKVLCIVHIQEI